MRHNILLISPTIQPNGVQLLEARANVFLATDGERDTLIRWMNAHKIQAVLTRCENIGAQIMDAAPTLKVVGQHGVGLDNIDVEAATKRGVKVLNVPDANYISVAEHTVAFILALSRRLNVNDMSVRTDGWFTRESRYTQEIYQKTLLIVGLGRIGKAVAVRAQAFGMRVVAHDGMVSGEAMEALGIVKAASLEMGLREADYVSLHVPLTRETEGMISHRELEVMKRSACIINMGRGPVVDESALIQALEAGEIGGAGLDVLDREPPAPDNPLLEMDQVLFTPHIGGDTIEAKRRTSGILAETVLEALDGGEPYNWVNRDPNAE